MKFIAYFNLLGVLVLAALCAVQWQANRRLNLQVIDLERTRQQQVQKMTEQDRTIKGYASDLDEFRRRLEQSDSALKEAETKVATLGMERDQLLAERDRNKIVLEKWMAAVMERDEAIKKGNDEILKLAQARNDAVAKFNDLATKYNAVVKELNAGRGK